MAVCATCTVIHTFEGVYQGVDVSHCLVHRNIIADCTFISTQNLCSTVSFIGARKDDICEAGMWWEWSLPFPVICLIKLDRVVISSAGNPV